jgi:gamma-glutamyltranspeptidase/glutathione hydrolase
MVSSANPLATRAGLDLLAQGGTAFDAAVGVAAALNVVEPENSGLGGYGTLLLYDSRRGETLFLNASGRIPRRVRGDAFRSPTPGHLANRRGAKAVSTPGNLHAWESLWERGGTLPWPALFAPAIRAAREGFPLAPRTAWALAQTYDSFPESARPIYGVDGIEGDGARPLGAGDLLVQDDLGSTLERIADEGSEPFYRGDLAARIASEVETRGGYLAADDLADDRAEEWPTVSIRYRGHHVVVPAPPASSFPALVRLGILSRFDLSHLTPGSAEYLHLFAEVTRRGSWFRLAFAGDPEVEPPPLDRLLGEPLWREEAAAFDPQRAQPFAAPEPKAVALAGRHTTHFVVADQHGNVVSATQTIGNLFGSRVQPPGTGVWLNDSLAYCTFEPAGNPMDAHPGRRKLSGDCPAFVMRDGLPAVALGTPGGHTIDQTVPQILVNLLDFEMDLAEALAAPRIGFLEPDRLAVEEGVPEEVRRDLASRGHRLEICDRIGNAHALTLEHDAEGRPRRFAGAADPRGDGQALGL